MKKIFSITVASIILLSLFNSCVYAGKINNNEITKQTSDLLVFNTTLSANSKVESDEPIYLSPLSKIDNQSLNLNNTSENEEISDINIEPLTGEHTYVTSHVQNKELLDYFENLNKTTPDYDYNYKRNQLKVFDNYEYQVGDTRTFYQSWSTSNATVVKEQTTIECMYIGEHCTVWADADETNNYNGALKITLSISEEIANTFDSKWDNICNYFGNYLTIPSYTSSGAVNKGDADLDGKLAIVCYDINKDYEKATSGEKYSGTYTAGFYQSIDNERSIKNKYGSQYFLNYMDCIHIDTFPGMGAYKDTPFSNVQGAYSTLMHEFEHLIQRSYGESYETYINEGAAMAAEHLLFGPEETTSRVNYFNNSYVKGRSLTSWYGTNTEKLSSYASSYLLMQYLRTQYSQTPEAKSNGDTYGNSFYKRLSLKYKELNNTGLKSYEKMDICYQDILGVDITTLYKNFWIACLLKKSSGPYGFAGENWANAISPRKTNKSSPPTLYNGGCLFFENTNAFQEESFGNIEYIPIANINIFDSEGKYKDTVKSISGKLQSYSSLSDFDILENKTCIGVYNSILDEFYSEDIDIKYDSDLYPIYIKTPKKIYSPNENIDKYINNEDLTINTVYIDKSTNEKYTSRPTKEGYYDVEFQIKSNNSINYIYKAEDIYFETYKIYFRDSNNNLLQDSTIEYYDELDISLPEGPTIENYSFIGWSGDTSTLLSGDTTFTATYIKNLDNHYYFDQNIPIITLPENIDLNLHYEVIDKNTNITSNTLPNNCGNFKIDIKTDYDKNISTDNISIQNIWKDSITFDVDKTYHKITFMGGLDNNTVIEEIFPITIPESIDDAPHSLEVDGYTFFGYKGDITLCKNQDVTLTSIYYKKITEVLGGESYSPITNYNGLVNYAYDNDDYESQQNGLPVNDGIYFVYPYFQELGLFDYTEYILVNITDIIYNVSFTDFDGNKIDSLTQHAALTNSIILPDESTVPNIEGYKFLGWYGYNDLGERLSNDILISSIYISTPKEKYKLGESINLTCNINNAEITYEYFDSKNNKLDSLPLIPGQFKVTSSITLGGKELARTNFEVSYEKLYKVNFLDKDGNTISSINTQEVKNKADIVLPKAENVPEVEGYKFIGWYGYEELADELESDVLLQTMYIEIPDIQSTGKNMEELDINIPGAKVVYTYYDLKGKVLEGPPSIPGTYKVEATIMLNGKELTKTSFDVEFKNTQIPNIPIYRLYNPISGEHLFTSKVGEYNKLPGVGWVQEGMTFDAYAENNKPEEAIAVYRLFNPMGFGGKGDHHYTKSQGEVNKLVKAGWSLDFNGQPAFYVAGKITVYKMYDKKSGAHHYTPKLGEKKNMEKAGWVTEGVAWTVNGYYSNNGTQRTSDENM